MKYVLYVLTAFVAILLFCPTTDGQHIRNLPLLIVIIAIIVGLLIYRLIRRAVFMKKVKKTLKNSGCEIIKTHFNPFASRLKGRYSITFKKDGKTICATLLMKKRKYQRYHFANIDYLEFYRSNRVVFNSTRTRGAIISDLVETKLVGNQKLIWDEADVNLVVFNKIPDHITDSKTKNLLGKGDKICGTETYIADVEHLMQMIK